MATEKSNSISQFQPYLECDICGSTDIVDTDRGYVCRDCGIVLEIQKLQYDKPYNENIVQYSRRLGTTQIGTKRERLISPDSRRLDRLNRYNLVVDNEKAEIEKARAEISTIFSNLNISEYKDLKDMVLEKFKQIRSKLRKRTKYRNTEKLVSVIAYLCLKLRNISVTPYELVDASRITKKELNDFILHVQLFLPEYAKRNRVKNIQSRIYELSEHFELGMSFYHLAQKILDKLWNGIKDTTDNAVVGLVSSISVLCSCKDKVSISAICTHLGIRMSTVQSQVKKKIFNRFRVKRFTGLVKSSDILVKIMEKLGIIGENKIEIQEEVATSGRVEIVLGKAAEIFNGNNNFDYYYFAVRGEDNTPIIVTLKINDLRLDLKSEKNPEVQNNNLLDFELYKYYHSKGPPKLET